MEPEYCGGKRAYDKKGAVTARNKRYEDEHVELRMYECGDHWHLTKQMRGERHILYKRKHIGFRPEVLEKDYEIE